MSCANYSIEELGTELFSSLSTEMGADLFTPRTSEIITEINRRRKIRKLTIPDVLCLYSNFIRRIADSLMLSDSRTPNAVSPVIRLSANNEIHTGVLHTINTINTINADNSAFPKLYAILLLKNGSDASITEVEMDRKNVFITHSLPNTLVQCTRLANI